MSSFFLRPLNLLLVGVLLLLTLTIVYNTHNYRQQTIQLRNAERMLNQLKIEYARLRLEEGVLADYRKIKQQAETRLRLRTPLPEQHVRATP